MLNRTEARGDEMSWGGDGWRRGKEVGRLSREGGPAAAGCRNVSHACPLNDLASLECGRYWK